MSRMLLTLCLLGCLLEIDCPNDRIVFAERLCNWSLYHGYDIEFLSEGRQLRVVNAPDCAEILSIFEPGTVAHMQELGFNILYCKGNNTSGWFSLKTI